MKDLKVNFFLLHYLHELHRALKEVINCRVTAIPEEHTTREQNV